MALPIIELEFGRKLTSDEVQRVLTKNIKANEDFKKITAKLRQFDLNEIEVLAANKAEFVSEGVVTFITRIVLKSGNEVVYYQAATKENRIKEVVTAAVYKNEKELTTFMIYQDEVVETEFDHNGDTIEDRDFEKGFPNNEDYVEGQSLTVVKAQYEWGDGCYPTYKHCGRNCGDNGDYGGGTPKNVYDECCRTHDRCWAQFGTNDCQCDCDLEACAKRNWTYGNPTLHSVLLAYFPVKDSCKC